MYVELFGIEEGYSPKFFARSRLLRKTYISPLEVNREVFARHATSRLIGD